jgi:CRP-like cAMP-binding protein
MSSSSDSALDEERMARKLTLEHIIQFLIDAPMFGDLDANELSRIVHIMQVRTLGPGQFVFREGDPGDAWYVVYDGEVEVTKQTGDGERVIALLGKRACFGEMAILDGSPRSAGVRCPDGAVAFRFARADFNQLLASDNLAAYKLVHQMALVLVSRQRQTTSRLVNLMGSEQGGAVRRQLTPIVDQSSVAE